MVTVTATMNGAALSSETTVTVSVHSDSTAASGTDYVAVSAFTVTVAANQSSGMRTFTFTPTTDSDLEGDETVVLAGTAAGLTGGQATLTLTDATQMKLTAVLDAGVNGGVTKLNEGESTTISATIPIMLRDAVTITVSSVRTFGGMSEEVLSAQRTLTIAANSTSSTGTVTFSTTDDHEGLGTSQYEVTLTADHSRVDPVTVRVVVREDDNSWIYLQPNPTRIFENGGSATLRAARWGLTSNESTLDVSLSPSSLATLSGTRLTFPPGAVYSTETLTVTAVDNNVDGSDETLTISATAVGGTGYRTPSPVRLTIVDDDGTEPAEVALRLSPIRLREGLVSTVTAESTKALSESLTITVSATPGHTDTLASDFVLSTNTVLTIPPGGRRSTGVVTIATVDDEIPEQSRNKLVTVSGTVPADSGITAPADQTLTILEDDTTPIVAFVATPPTISEDGGVSTITLRALQPLANTVTVTVRPPGRRATLSTNTVLTIGPGQTESTGTVTLTALDDADTSNSVVRVSGTASPATAYLRPAQLYIIDDDFGQPVLSVNLSPSSIYEGDVCTVTATLSAELENDVTVTIGVDADDIDHSATSNDYTMSANRTLTITAGSTSSTGTVTFTATDDEFYGLRSSRKVALKIEALTGIERTNVVRHSDLLILEDERAPVATLTVRPALIGEGSGQSVVTAKLNTKLRSDVEFTVNSIPVLPATTSDFIQTGSTLTIRAGTKDSTGTVQIAAVDNAIVGPDKHVVVSGSLVVSEPEKDVPVRFPNPEGITITDDDESADDDSGSRKQPGSPAITLWTDKHGYGIDETTRVYLDIDPRGDEREYSLFVCRENIETGERLWLAPWTGTTALHEPVVDYYGRTEDTRQPGRLWPVEKELIWEGRVPEPGLWHFVFELRSPDTAQVAKTAYAKFVVTRNGSRLLARRGTRRIIAEDTRLASDWIHNLGGQLHVKRGATLTIDAGTLIKAHDPSAAIVVEPGARIVARGRREAPIVMTCSRPVGKRRPGCWGGLRVFGRAAAVFGRALLNPRPDGAATAGRGSLQDSSGELRYLRVEFAGGGSVNGARSAGILLDGVGPGTVLEHVQVHASLGDGIVFRGGGAHCKYCVASEVRHDSLAWRDGWHGSAQFVYVQQGAEAICGIRGHSSGPSVDRGVPALWNVTLVGGYNIGTLGGIPGSRQSIGPGVFLERDAAFTAGNLLVTGFAELAIDGSAASFAGGRSRIDGAFLTYTGYGDRRLSQVSERFEPYVRYLSRDPDLRNVPYGANPDPRPRSGSEALRFINAAVPPYNGSFTRSANHVGAFGMRNWLDEWTFFGPESDYEVPDE